MSKIELNKKIKNKKNVESINDCTAWQIRLGLR
jgi:hypothetical protein